MLVFSFELKFERLFYHNVFAMIHKSQWSEHRREIEFVKQINKKSQTISEELVYNFLQWVWVFWFIEYFVHKKRKCSLKINTKRRRNFWNICGVYQYLLYFTFRLLLLSSIVIVIVTMMMHVISCAYFNFIHVVAFVLLWFLVCPPH